MWGSWLAVQDSEQDQSEPLAQGKFINSTHDHPPGRRLLANSFPKCRSQTSAKKGDSRWQITNPQCSLPGWGCVLIFFPVSLPQSTEADAAAMASHDCRHLHTPVGIDYVSVPFSLHSFHGIFIAHEPPRESHDSRWSRGAQQADSIWLDSFSSSDSLLPPSFSPFIHSLPQVRDFGIPEAEVGFYSGGISRSPSFAFDLRNPVLTQRNALLRLDCLSLHARAVSPLPLSVLLPSLLPCRAPPPQLLASSALLSHALSPAGPGQASSSALSPTVTGSNCA